MPSSRVSVIVPTRDRPAPLARLLHSLLDNRWIEEIIVVDDASSPPATVTLPGIRVIRLEERSMVSAVRNQGAETAKGNVLVFVDDDCVAAPGAIDQLARVVLQDEGVGIAGPVLAYLSSPERVWCAGVVRTRWLGRTRFVAQGQSVRGLDGTYADCLDFPSAFALRRACFQEVGGFDEVAFPMHMEEADLAARVRRSGYSIRLVHEALIWHDIRPEGSPARRLHLTDPDRAFMVGRSRERYLRRHGRRGLAGTIGHLYWRAVLVPGYVIAILSDRDQPSRSRIRVATTFLHGVFAGIAGR
jgi:GT2 family glycosyltransferase